MSGNFFGGRFFGGGFFGAIILDTHDGFDSNKKRHKKRIQEREELRTQILEAIDGPLPVELEQELEKHASPQIHDSVYIPLSKRVDFDSISDEVVGELTKVYEQGKKLEAIGKEARAYQDEQLRQERLDEEAVMVFVMLSHH